MNKLKELWQYPVFRWCVLVIPHSIVLVFLLISIDNSWFGMGWYTGRGWEFASRLIVIVSISLGINFLVSTIVILGKQIKTLWSKALFRYFSYCLLCLFFSILILVILELLPYHLGFDGDPFAIPLLFLSFTLPTIWVWRKPLIRFVLRLSSFLNRVANDDSK